ncbi:hypothetical protein ACVXHA_24520 [Escherichia coli]
MLRSPHAHALITHLDVSKAEALPGVVHVITHLNCPDITIPRVVRAHRNRHRLTAVCWQENASRRRWLLRWSQKVKKLRSKH